MQLTIVTPDKKLVDAQTSSITLPGEEGEMTILQGHTYILAALKNGEIRYTGGSPVSIEEGWVEVADNQVLVVALNSTSLHQ